MTYKEFLIYLEENFDGYAVFMEKATDFQETKNQKRPAKSRWKEAKVQKAVCEMWKKSMQPLYDNLKREIEYMEQHEVLEGLRDTMADRALEMWINLLRHFNKIILKKEGFLWDFLKIYSAPTIVIPPHLKKSYSRGMTRNI